MFLTLLDSGSWTYIDSNRVKHRFPAGVHEVSDEIAEVARGLKRRNLLVTDVAPRIVRDEGSDGPLTMEDLRVGTKGVRLLQDEAVEVEVEEDLTVPLDFPCLQCVRAFPSAPSRDRHMEMNHGN